MYTENDNKTVSILGTEYKIIFMPEGTGILKDENADGLMNSRTKELHVAIFQQDAAAKKGMGIYQKKVMRHEIIHAFLHESGLWQNSNDIEGWAMNEEMVDWIAIQHSKLHTAFKEAGCL